MSAKKKTKQVDLIAMLRRRIRRRQGIANRAAQDAALMGHKYLVDFHMGGHSLCYCLLEDLDRLKRGL